MSSNKGGGDIKNEGSKYLTGAVFRKNKSVRCGRTGSHVRMLKRFGGVRLAGWLLWIATATTVRKRLPKKREEREGMTGY